jgi:hypothetical protein
MSIELTQDQQTALDNQPGPQTMVDPRTNTAYVLLRKEVFERIQLIMEADGDTEGAFLAQIESAAAAGWGNPAMDVYDQLDPRRQS